MSVRVLPPPKVATLDDLMKVEGKAELINGRIVRYMPTGYRPSVVSGRIFRSLADYAEARQCGEAFTDQMGFAIPRLSSGRQSFSPDASYYDGPVPSNPMKFAESPPKFAAEVRSENDYGPAAERAMADKRADYFEAGTSVVWDVDPVNEFVDCYRSATPDQPARFVKGQIAEAEPALPGWSMAVDRLLA